MKEDTGGVLAEIRSSPPGGLSPARYQALSRELHADAHGLQRVRLVLLSTYTTDLLTAFLRVEGARHGLEIDVWHGGYGQIEQALVGDLSWRAPDGVADVLLLAMRLEDLDPDRAFRHYASGFTFEDIALDVLGRIGATLELFRAHSAGPALVANFAAPWPRPLGVFDAGDVRSLSHGIARLNLRLAEMLANHAGAHVWDYAGLVSQHGAEQWCDPRLWALSRTPVAARHHPALGAHLARSVRGVLRPAAKCVVVDLDETLWGGVVGDDGLRGIRLGDDHPGNAYKSFQRALLGLRDRGILLAVCSKNDEAVAREAIDGHPEMLLRWSDFSAHRVNWASKGGNLIEIAEELNIGPDALVFFDDNPVERAEVRHTAPAVHVVEVPTDPGRYVDALAAVAALDTQMVTAEDRRRAEYYEGQVARREAERSVTPEQFLASLEMKAAVGGLDASTSQRIAQLVGKTNQFNLTTKRYSQGELEALATAPTSTVQWLRLGDRYGDMGLICVAVLRFDGDIADIDSLVLSCRAANRGIEQTMVAHLARLARDHACNTLVGHYAPTAKNTVVKNLYDELGFVRSHEDSETRRYTHALTDESIRVPQYVELALEPVS